ncbi:MAG TPA: hypothetical protein VMQ93_07145 [Novosphingobium sp.]|nr:hypothetical protein [Novosphingobium sp.]
MKHEGVRRPAIGPLRWAAGGALLAVVAWGGWMIAHAADQARDALADSMPGFACEGMVVDLGKTVQRWNGGVYASASLTIPSECRADFESRMRIRFSPETCNGVEACWKRRRDGTVLTLIPQADRVRYTFEKDAPSRDR